MDRDIFMMDSSDDRCPSKAPTANVKMIAVTGRPAPDFIREK